MLPATPTLTRTKRTSANIHSPRVMKNIAAAATAPIAMNTASIRFLTAE